MEGQPFWKEKTDIEEIMKNALKEAEIEVVPEFPIRCKYGYRIDYAIPDLKIGIECDGESYHPEGNPHDRKRDAFLKKFEWEMLRFKGQEIKNNIVDCIGIIKKTIERRLKNVKI